MLREEMGSDDISRKVDAIHMLQTIILSMGIDETKRKLIGYLTDLIKTQPDEVLFAIASQLGKINLSPSLKIHFLPLLETLCNADETVVRE